MSINPHLLEEDDFSPEILSAFDAYPAPSPSKGFEASFWSQFENRRTRYRGVIGFLRRLWELEIEGVVVWRLAASTLTGGGGGALLLGLLAGSPTPSSSSSPLPPRPLPLVAMSSLALYNREWETDLYVPKPLPQSAPPHPTRQKGDEFSWNGSSAPLA